MSVKTETEADTRADRIDPVLATAGWGWDGSKIRREVICPGRIQSGGTRGKSLSADYVLMHKGQKLGVIEAKRAGLSHRKGVAQAKDYATRLGARFAWSSNGIGWYQIDMRTGAEGEAKLPFPSQDTLWERTFGDQNKWRERFGTVEFETDGGKWELRYYQHKAINAALEAIAQDQRRILLTLATGTGKTSIAFQIAWTLFHAKWNTSGEPVRRPRTLFLADRNILANQAFNAFSAFSDDAVTRIYEGKDFFTIWDFVKAHENFNDPEWDGEPLEPEPPRPTPPVTPPEPTEPPGEPEGDDEDEPREKIRIKLADGKTRTIQYIATTTYWSADGKPISAQEFMKRLFGDLTGLITDEDHLRKVWSDPDSRETFLKQLSDRGYDDDRLNDIRRLVDAPDSDLFDVLGYVLFTNAPKTREDRAEAVKGDKLGAVQDDLKSLLIKILDAYEENGEG